MTYDYRNPGIPHRGDGRYDKKFPNTYQVIDCLREHYYDLFKEDISFNGGNEDYFGAPETHVYSIVHTCKNFFGFKDKKPVFTFEIQENTFQNPDNHVAFRLRKELFETEMNEQILQFLKLCTHDLVGREINFVNSCENKIKFMYIPYDKSISYRDYIWVDGKCEYTSEYFLLFLQLYYDNIFRYINYIDDDIKARLNAFELSWLEHMVCDVNQSNYFMDRERNIEIGPKLSYVRVKDKK